jgi:hypothetical protein
MRAFLSIVSLLAVAWIAANPLTSAGSAGLDPDTRAPVAAPVPETWSPEVPLFNQGTSSFVAALPAPGSGSELPGRQLPTRPATSKIVVTYYDFPPEARAAFEFAKATWEQLLTSSADMLVSAYWERMDAPLLGTNQTRWFVKDQDADKKLPVANVLYPAALANAIRGSRVDTTPDMRVRLNSSAAWYFGTDGNVPRAGADLVTVALHEIGQSFGISSGFNIVNGVVSTRSTSGLLTIFDQFVVSGDGQRLAALFAAKSPTLSKLLTGGNLFFDGPSAVAASAGTRPRLYAPTTWSASSSVSHLDRNTYEVPNVNALMAPNLYDGWAIHDPGPIGLAILKDLGWTISGLGAPARLTINTLASLAWDGKDLPIQPRVTVQDPIGGPVPPDSSIEVTLHLMGSRTFTGARCSGIPYQTVLNSVAKYTGCYFEGFGWAWMYATADGLANGFSNLFVVLGKNRAFIPAVVGDH